MAALKTAKTWIRGTNETELPAGSMDIRDNPYYAGSGEYSATRSHAPEIDSKDSNRQRTGSASRIANGAASRQQSSPGVKDVISQFEQTSMSTNGSQKRLESHAQTRSGHEGHNKSNSVSEDANHVEGSNSASRWQGTQAPKLVQSMERMYRAPPKQEDRPTSNSSSWSWSEDDAPRHVQSNNSESRGSGTDLTQPPGRNHEISSKDDGRPKSNLESERSETDLPQPPGRNHEISSKDDGLPKGNLESKRSGTDLPQPPGRNHRISSKDDGRPESNRESKRSGTEAPKPVQSPPKSFEVLSEHYVHRRTNSTPRTASAQSPRRIFEVLSKTDDRPTSSSTSRSPETEAVKRVQSPGTVFEGPSKQDGLRRKNSASRRSRSEAPKSAQSPRRRSEVLSKNDDHPRRNSHRVQSPERMSATPLKDYDRPRSKSTSRRSGTEAPKRVESPERRFEVPSKHEGHRRSNSASRLASKSSHGESGHEKVDDHLDDTHFSFSKLSKVRGHDDLHTRVQQDQRSSWVADNHKGPDILKTAGSERKSTKSDRAKHRDLAVKAQLRRSSSTSKLTDRASREKRLSLPSTGRQSTPTKSRSSNSKPFTRSNSTGNLRQEIDTNTKLRSSTNTVKKENILNSASKRPGLSGSSKQSTIAADAGNVKQERGFSPAGRQRSSSNLKAESSSTLVGTRKGSFGNLEQAHASNLAGRRHSSSGNMTQESPAVAKQSSPGSLKQETLTGSRQGSSGNLKQESAANSVNTGQSSTGNRAQEGPRTRRASAPTKLRASFSDRVPLGGVAAAVYNGGWVPSNGMMPYRDDSNKLNKFLSECKSEVEAGVPGRYLTVVMGNDASELDSIVSSIAYAYFLSSTDSEERQIFVPLLNMRREDFTLRTEAVWLFEVTGVDTSNLIFVDQISLSYYHRFGSLRLVLVDHSRLAPHQENLQEAVVEIVDHNVPENLYPWVSTLEIEQVGSCCTIIAERYAAEASELLAGRGLSRLLLGPILLDTANLDSKFARCTSRDECMAAFLINGAGQYGQHGFFRLLRKKKFDVSTLSTKDMMRKDFKKWTLGPGKTDVYGYKGRVIVAGMSTLGVPLVEFLSRNDILDEFSRFLRGLKLDVHLIVTGYYDIGNRYKREILVVPGDGELIQQLRTCFDAQKEELKLSPLHIEGLPKAMMVFKQGNVTASRRTVRELITDFFSE